MRDSSFHALPAPTCPASHRRRLLALFALLFLCLSLLGVVPAHSVENGGRSLLAATPASPVSSPVTASPAPRPPLLPETTNEDGLEVRITDLSPSVLTTEDHVTVSATVRNTGITDVGRPTFTLHLPWAQSATSSETLFSDLSGTSELGASVWFGEAPEPLGAGMTRSFSFSIPVSSLDLPVPAARGAKVLTLRAETEESVGSDRTVLVWNTPSDASPTRLAVLLPWTQQTLNGKFTANATPTESHVRHALTDLAQIPGVTLAIEGSLFDSQSASLLNRPADTGEETSPQSSADSSTELDASTEREFWTGVLAPGREFIALPVHDADLGLTASSPSPQLNLLARNSRSDVRVFLTKIHSALTTSPDSDKPQSGPPPAEDTPASTQPLANETHGVGDSTSPDAAAPPRPRVRTDVSWVRDSFSPDLLSSAGGEIVVAPVEAFLRDTGSVPTAHIEFSSGATDASHHSGATTTVLVNESGIGELLAWDPTTPADLLDQRQLLASLGTVPSPSGDLGGSGGSSLLVAIPRDTPITPALASRITTLLSYPWIEGTEIAALASQTAPLRDHSIIASVSPTQETTESALNVASSMATLHTLISAVESPREALSSVRDESLAPLRCELSSESRKELANRFNAHVNTLMHGVVVESSGTVNLINKSANFPVRVRSDLDWPIRVRVNLTPSDPRLRVQEAAHVVVPAHASVTAEVPVEAIGSGDLHVTYEVSTPAGHVLDASSKVFVRLRAGWEDTATAVMGVFVAIAFIIGLVRSIRRRSRRREQKLKNERSGLSKEET